MCSRNQRQIILVTVDMPKLNLKYKDTFKKCEFLFKNFIHETNDLYLRKAIDGNRRLWSNQKIKNVYQI